MDLISGVVGASRPQRKILIRATRRLVAFHVECAADAQLDEAAHHRIQKHLQLAKELGAETLTVAGETVAKKLVEVALQYDISRVVVGRSRRRGRLRLRASLAEEIIELSENLDVLILS